MKKQAEILEKTKSEQNVEFILNQKKKLNNFCKPFAPSENNRDLIFSNDLDGNVLFMNQELLNTIGPIKKQLAVRNTSDLPFEYKIDKIISLVNDSHSGSRSFLYRTFLSANNKNAYTIEFNIIPLKSKADRFEILNIGRIIQQDNSSPAIRDMDNLLKEKINLMLSEIYSRSVMEKFHLIAENLSDNVWIIDAHSLSFNYVSPATLELLGYSFDEIRQMTIRDIMNESCYKSIIDKIRKSLSIEKKEKSDIKKVRNIEVEIFDKNHNHKWMQVRASLARDENGHIREILGIALDITGSKKTEKEYQNSIEKFRLLAENTSDNIWIMDILQKKISYCSHGIEKITGFSSEEILYKDFSRIFTPDSFRILKQHINDFYDKDKNIYQKIINGITIELEMWHKTKGSVWTEVCATGKEENDGNITEILGITRDISERKKAEEELKRAKNIAEESEKLKTAFLANMSHEIRTPMNAIIGYAALMSEDNPNSEHKEYLENINNNGKLLLSIIENILNLSKLEAGQFTIEHIPFCIKTLFHEIYSDTLLLLENKKDRIEFSYDIPDKISNWIYGDPTRMQMIFNNLLSNAIKFTEKGHIKFVVELCKNNRLHFYVKDSGTGIPAEKQEVIFNSFRQADACTTRQYGGTGLGLTITKRLITLMGSEINIKSKTGENHGSTFYFSLPYEIAEKENETEKPLPGEDESPAKKYRILLVEDNIINQKLTLKILEKFGYMVETASNGHEAIRKYESDSSINLILMDMQMPVIDGFEATKRIRFLENNHKHTPRTPIIALTAAAMRGDRENCIKAGCDHYIAKPFNYQELNRCIQKYLNPSFDS